MIAGIGFGPGMSAVFIMTSSSRDPQNSCVSDRMDLEH